MQGKFFILFMLFCSNVVIGQQPAFKNYNTKNGMPTFNYFYLSYTNDSIFVTTDEVAMYSFDGIKFTKLKSPPSKYMFKNIRFLKKGYFMRNTVNHYWYKHPGQEWETIKKPETFIIQNDTLIGFRSDSVFYFDEDKIRWKYFRKIPNPEVNIKKYHPYLFYDKNNKEILTLIRNKSPQLLYDIMADTFIDLEKNKFRCQGIINDQKLYLEEHTGLIKWKYLKQEVVDLKKIIPFPDIISIIEGKKFRIINKFNNSDYFLSSNIIQKENLLNFFTFDTISGINYSGTFDIARANFQKIRENLYFIGSFEGMYRINPNITFYSPSNSGINKSVRSIVEHNGKIWTGGYGSGFCRLDENKFVNSSADFMQGTYKNILNGGFAVSKNEAWFFNEGDKTIFILKDNKIRSCRIFSNGIVSTAKGFYIDTLNDGRLAFSMQYENFGILDSVVGDKIYINTISDLKGIKHGNSWSFDQDINGRIWLSRFTAGLSVYDMVADTVISFDYNLDIKKSFGVISMYIDKYDRLWLGSNAGLFIVPEISKFNIFNDDVFNKVIPVELPNGDKSLVSSIKKVGKYIVAGNRTGISFIKNYENIDDILSHPIHELIYGEDINGISTEQNCMHYDGKRYLWVSTIVGVLKIDMLAIGMDTTGVEIDFDEIKNADNLLKIVDDKIKISSVKRNIRISFSPKYNPSFLNNIYYDYFLTNRKNDTIAYKYRVKNNVFSIDYLSPDNYDFEVKAYKNGILMDTAALEISVPYTFMENPWVWVVIVGIVLGILSINLFNRKEYFKKLSKKEKELSQIQSEKEQLKVQAVISAFNPHFINNSLHWVQSKYYKDPEMTNMIGKLSANIQYIFNKAKSGYAIHTLKDEIYLVTNYITIQKIRFGDSFRFILPGEDILTKYGDENIILMQIQIHVENAIEHGIRNRPESSFVEIGIAEEKDFLIITITDDGIGRNTTKKMKSRGSQSGVKMLKELHSIFNKNHKNKKDITSYYEDDIFEENGMVFGTRVVIKIPVGFIFEIG